MAVTDIKQEIVDWFNDNIEGESTEYLSSYAFREFLEALSAESEVGKPFSWREGVVTTAVLASGPAYLEADVHGEDGNYEARYIVFSVGDQLFEVAGYYSSWDGDNWDGAEPFEVESYEETVIRYKKKGS